MMEIEPPDSYYLSGAMGWLELRNTEEARLELAKVHSRYHTCPEFLEMKWLICAAEKNWREGLSVAQMLVDQNPDLCFGWLHQAYALRRVPDGGVHAAWDALLPAAERFPTEPTIPYNLSCYACQMGRLDVAREWLRRAFQIGDRRGMKAMALADEDLEPLWSEIKTW